MVIVLACFSAAVMKHIGEERVHFRRILLGHNLALRDVRAGTEAETMRKTPLS